VIAPPLQEPATGTLASCVIAPPILALLNQEAIFGTTGPLCARGLHGTLHAIPALCLTAVAIAGVMAFAIYRRPRRASPSAPDRSELAGRTHFLASLAMMIGAVSALVILAQWLAVVMIRPCLGT
jgi:hypothetical protein